MGFRQRASVATAAVLTAATVAACGGSSGHWLAAAQANRLTADLNAASTALDSGDCAQAQRYLTRFQNALGSLGNANSTLVANLNQGVSTVQSLASSTCHVRVAPKPTRPKRRTHTNTGTTPVVTTFTNTISQPTVTTPSQTTTIGPTTSTTGGASPVPATVTSTTPATSTTGGGGAGSLPGGGAGASGGPGTSGGG